MAKKKNSTRRSHGEGTIYQMKDGRYGAAVSLGTDENGKRIRPKVTGITEDEVREKMAALLQARKLMEVNNGNLPTVNSLSTVEEFVTEFKLCGLLGKSSISSRTYEGYEYNLKKFVDYFAGYKIGTITTYHLNQFFRTLEKSKGPSGEYLSQTTLDRVKFIVDKMYRRGVSKRYITYNPFADEDFSPPVSKQEEKEILALSPEEMNTVFSLIESHPFIYPVLEIMINSGVRTQEALGLRWKDIDLKNGIMHIRNAITIEVEYDTAGNKKGRKTVLSTTKQGKGKRIIHLDNEPLEVLKKWHERMKKKNSNYIKHDAFVFRNRHYTPWTYSHPVHSPMESRRRCSYPSRRFRVGLDESFVTNPLNSIPHTLPAWIPTICPPAHPKYAL